MIGKRDNETLKDEELLQSMTDSLVDELEAEEVILFGSRADGTARKGSDVDLLIIVPDSEEARRHRRLLTGRAYRRLGRYPVAKDILVYIRSEAERWRHVQGHIVSTILSQGRRLYGRT